MSAIQAAEQVQEGWCRGWLEEATARGFVIGSCLDGSVLGPVAKALAGQHPVGWLPGKGCDPLAVTFQ